MAGDCRYEMRFDNRRGFCNEKHCFDNVERNWLNAEAATGKAMPKEIASRNLKQIPAMSCENRAVTQISVRRLPMRVNDMPRNLPHLYKLSLL